MYTIVVIEDDLITNLNHKIIMYLQGSEFTTKHAEVLFNSKLHPNLIFKLLDTNKDNQVGI